MFLAFGWWILGVASSCGRLGSVRAAESSSRSCKTQFIHRDEGIIEQNFSYDLLVNNEWQSPASLESLN